MIDFDVNKVRKFLDKYLDVCLAYAGLHPVDLLDTNLDKLFPLPVMSKTDSALTARLKYATIFAACFGKAINSCTSLAKKPYKQILVKNYLQGVPCFKVENELGYSERSYFRFKTQALLQFAGFFDYYQKKYKLTPAVDMYK